jgi:hypothetical protein
MFDQQNKIAMETNFNTLAKEAAEYNPTQREGQVARSIEEQTAKLPSDTFLWASLGAMATSLTLKIVGRDHLALFVGQWVAPFLLLGIYNKLVKLQGHDKES